MLDHPVIRNLERTGTPDGKPERYPICPICGSEDAAIIYRDRTGDIVGCDCCMEELNAWEWMEADHGKRL